MFHDFADKEYWKARWKHCFPCTYPPELYTYKMFPTVHSYRFLFWKWEDITFHEHGACLRCGERISTGHYCRDLQE